MIPFNKFYNINLILEKKQPSNITTVFIPGSFKPGHRGHWKMVKHYSKIAGPTGKVFVVIGNPKVEKRLTAHGKEITAATSKKIFEIFEDATKLGNVKIVVSDIPSPIKWASEYAKKNLNDPKNSVIFGCSSKDEDVSRYSWLKKWYNKENLKFKLEDAEENAAKPFEDLNATALRKRIDDEDYVASAMPKELSKEDISKIIALLK